MSHPARAEGLVNRIIIFKIILTISSFFLLPFSLLQTHGLFTLYFLVVRLSIYFSFFFVSFSSSSIFLFFIVFSCCLFFLFPRSSPEFSLYFLFLLSFHFVFCFLVFFFFSVGFLLFIFLKISLFSVGFSHFLFLSFRFSCVFIFFLFSLFFFYLFTPSFFLSFLSFSSRSNTPWRHGLVRHQKCIHALLWC